MNICIVEDHGYKNLYPLTKTRPVFGLRCGQFTIEERILNLLGSRVKKVHYIMRPELESVWKIRNKATIPIDFKLPGNNNCLYLNSRTLFDENSLAKIMSKTEKGASFVLRNELCWSAVYMHDRTQEVTMEDLKNGSFDFPNIEDQETVDHLIISYPWDLIRYNSSMIRKDFIFIKKGLRTLLRSSLPEQAAVFNVDNIMIGKSTDIQPFVTLDAREGPIIIGNRIKIESGAYIKGPVFIGDDSLVTAHSRLNDTTIGNFCKLGGEISHSIIHGYSNKRHNGFLGNSYLGEWINIGAGTNNSNLKNNYETISVRLNGRTIDTNNQFIGLYMGDHSRTAIGTRFNTGTIVGVGCNIFGNNIPPKKIDDFSWGCTEHAGVYNFQKFIDSARQMMSRRKFKMCSDDVELLNGIHQSRLIYKSHEDLMMKVI